MFIMKTVRSICLMLLAMLLPITAHATINIFACEPEWAALAEEIGADHVDVFSATSAQQDPHHIRARPSLIAAIRNADLLICSGAGLEEGWLPLLLQRAPSHLQAEQHGSLMTTHYVPLLETPKELDRSLGHLHAAGNPHIHLNPHHLLTIAKELTHRLQIIEPFNARIYQTNFSTFERSWQNAITEWEKLAKPLAGRSIISHHKAFTYLIDWLNMKSTATLEAVPGIPPTSSHLESLMQQLEGKKNVTIVRAPYDPDDASKWLSQKTQHPAIVLPFTVGGSDHAGDLYQLFDYSIRLLLETQHRAD